MKQLGNLALICAQRDDLCLNIFNGLAIVHIGYGPEKKQIITKWNDDEGIRKLTYELNHGEYKQEDTAMENESLQSVYLCYEVNCPDLSREAGAINEVELFFTKESRDAWIMERLKQAETNEFIVDEEIGSVDKLAELIKSDDSLCVTMFFREQDNWNSHFDIIAKLTNIKI